MLWVWSWIAEIGTPAAIRPITGTATPSGAPVMPCGSGRTLPSEPSITLGLKLRRDAASPWAIDSGSLTISSARARWGRRRMKPRSSERRDQPMDARLRAQVQRLLHLVERRRHARLLEPFVDEHEKLVLLAGQHRGIRLRERGPDRAGKQNRNKS
jgi:hypothetical protein